MAYWGYHLIIDASQCIPPKIRCSKNITNFTKALVKKIDMVPYGEPQVHHFGSGNKAGYSLVQLIETSNICGHFVEETNDMYLDVFSCKPFNPSDVEDMVRMYFLPIKTNHIFLNRQAPRSYFENEKQTPKLQLK
uniref:S-adenosylmethionine decarboxylase n=1 Tax=viral metagenome TaxID=1070528 RepID=A0A6C0ERB7_9ZZZZ